MIIVVMGVSGCGKSTVGADLAKHLKCDFQDADDFHPQANKDKMSNGIPLTDEDRWPWLHAIRDYMDKEKAAGRSVVFACSALKKAYRDLLNDKDDVHFVYLKGSEELIADRLSHRSSHFFNPKLLHSQFETLEDPSGEDNVFVVDIREDPDAIVNTVKKEMANWK
ncbi:MAG: gluconokinase [Zymomonas mobilis subsp. pomaceae]|uniref:Gluconokinase n=1 Tax=Zymomonas mobilis subsp. pomaceae (strain ATCC 29192 / DSM 22645 / JCM 10191 / CCUG 17912 / NBRC 13757 / NCIMB 11200 / NRRL B-4491 / Barker I) TaxID=579138 RepID=F8EV36_ZYMMT|nr:gluconokinase [Zymomonas mobilis]AEI38254.1 carbohydrate kinase, thermoresistant glucokinase family [Zymomonas mobilis subsp. pomaceae ATCC 29192]MDX5947943.1 gluconokinase [Zymomonas mobilis subsp. pomaceae]GEB89272.1 gluconokinase [Zymomonas mobilis subsp. pomaceae]